MYLNIQPKCTSNLIVIAVANIVFVYYLLGEYIESIKIIRLKHEKSKVLVRSRNEK